MASALNQPLSSASSSNDGEGLELEIQLASIVERDGVTMLSARGVRRRVERPKRQRAARSSNILSVSAEAIDESILANDAIAVLDTAVIDLLIRSVDEAPVEILSIRYTAHEASPHVVSLRGTFSSLYATPQLTPLHEGMFIPRGFSQEFFQDVSAFVQLARDLTLDDYHPHDIAHQQTPEDFFTAYRSQYGRLDFVGQLWRRLRPVSSQVPTRSAVEARSPRLKREREMEPVAHFPTLSPWRALAGFLALAVVFTLPAQAVIFYRSASKTRTAIETQGTSAVEDLHLATTAGSVPKSAEALRRASQKFREADVLMSESSALALGLASVLPKTYRSARSLLEAGDKASEAARLLALGFEKIFQDPTRHLDERLDVFAAYARGVLPLLSDASEAAGRVDPSTLPLERQAQIVALRDRLSSATSAVRDFSGVAEVLSQLVGRDEQRSYLVIFQNQTELRPTGGFIGSMAEITLDQGQIKKIHVPAGGSYDLKGQLTEHVIAPRPLHLINPHWQFQDGNWSPDFPTAAEKLRWFWSKSGQPTVDGVIAVNASFVENLLKITGPIRLPQDGKVISASNFLFETQKAVEIDYDKVNNTPKKFIGELTDALRDRVKTFDKEDWLRVMALMSESLDTKDIQVSLRRDDEETFAEQLGWSGRLKETAGDSLALIEANIAGQKTDGVIDEQVEHVVHIQADGHIEDELRLMRTHRGRKGDLFQGVRNVSYLRAFVPEGSELLMASGFEAPPQRLFKQPDSDYVPDQDVLNVESSERVLDSGAHVAIEDGRTVFGGWMQLDPGKTQTITLRYRLPMTVQDILQHVQSGQPASETGRAAYQLLLTSQSGKTQRALTSSLVTDDGWDVSWTRDGATSSTIRYDGLWDRDRVVSVLLQPHHEQETNH